MTKRINVRVFIHTSFKHIQMVSRCLKLYIKGIRPLISHHDIYTTYPVITCEIELF